MRTAVHRVFTIILFIVITLVGLPIVANSQPSDGAGDPLSTHDTSTYSIEELDNGRNINDPEDRIYKIANLTLRTAHNAVTILLWALGITIAGSYFGLGRLWNELKKFRSQSSIELEGANELISDCKTEFEKIKGEMIKTRDEIAGDLATADEIKSETESAREDVVNLKDYIDKELKVIEEHEETFRQLVWNLQAATTPGMDEDSQRTAIYTLAQLCRPELAPFFAHSLALSKPLSIRIAAAYALKLLGPQGQDFVDQVIEASYDHNSLLRRECAEALIAIGQPLEKICPRLREMTKDYDYKVRVIAEQGLAKLQCPDQD